MEKKYSIKIKELDGYVEFNAIIDEETAKEITAQINSLLTEKLMSKIISSQIT